MNSVGYRSWDCINGDLVDPKQIDGAANFSDALFAPSPGAEEVPVTGGFVYIDKVARFTIVTEDGTTYQFDLEPTPTLQNVTGTLSNSRWAVDWLDDPPPPVGLADLQAYLTRTNSTGGVTPTKCDDATAKTIVVPFTTTYTLYACPDGGVTPSSGASSATAHDSGAVRLISHEKEICMKVPRHVTSNSIGRGTPSTDYYFFRNRTAFE